MKRMIKQAALASKRSGPIFKFGVQIPCNEREACELEHILAKVFRENKSSQIRILVDQQGLESVFNLLDLIEYANEHQDAQVYLENEWHFLANHLSAKLRYFLLFAKHLDSTHPDGCFEE